MTDNKPPVLVEPTPTGAMPGAAGGIKAIGVAARNSVQEMGLVRSARTWLGMNQPHGFDCPGCAWPDPKHRATFEFCENGAKAVADEATRRRVGPSFFARHSVEDLRTRSDHWLNKQGRLTHPMVLEPGATHYTPISWEDALGHLGRELGALASPDEAIFYTSGRTSNEAAFLYQLFARRFGTNNLPDCSNMCHESSGTGLGEVIGVGKGTVTLEDFERAELIYIIGQNPGTNHPRMLSALRAAKKKGAHVISVNPLKEVALVKFQHPQKVSDVASGGTPISDQYLQVRLNGDVALLKAIMKAMLEEERRRPGEVFDHAFLDEYAVGLDDFLDDLEAADWDHLLELAGVTRDEVEVAAQRTWSSSRIIVCWAMGLTQHKNGVANVQSCANLLMLRGALGRPGAGACPVRGHSNVQGDRTMGIWERPTSAFLDRIEQVFGFEPPRHHGFDVVAAIKAMHERQAHVFVSLGGNFASATPDTEYTFEALRRVRLSVQISTKLNRSHLITGTRALILPCLGRTERDVQRARPQFVTVENSMGVVHRSRGSLEPASPHLWSEPKIVAHIAHATLGDDAEIRWLGLASNYDRIRDLIDATIPGFEGFNQRVRGHHGFALPNPVRDERVFRTATGKAHLTVHTPPEHDLAPGQLLMMTIRSHDQYNTTVYGLDDRYRGLYGTRRVLLLAPQDIEAQGLIQGQRVDISSHFEGQTRVAPGFLVIAYDMPPRTAATYFPEANVLIPVDSFADRSRTPTSKSVVISIEPSA